MITQSCIIDRKNEKNKLRKKQEFYLSTCIRKLQYAAETHNVELWDSVEDTFLEIIENRRCGVLNSRVKAKYIRTYHNIRPKEDFLYRK